MLIGRATACLGAGARNPERLDSAIATLDIVRYNPKAGIVKREQCQGWHVRPDANVRARVGSAIIAATVIGFGSSHQLSSVNHQRRQASHQHSAAGRSTPRSSLPARRACILLTVAHLEPITITSTGGLQLAGMLHHPARDDGGIGVIVVHGMLSSKDSAKHTAICEAVTDRGHTALRFDFRGRGESDGDPHELTVSNEIEDLQAAMAHLRSLGFGRIALVGSSLGGTVALLTASTDHCIAGLVTIAAPSRLPERPRESWGGTGAVDQSGLVQVAPDEWIHKTFFIDAVRHDPIGAASSIRCPWRIIHGALDPVVPQNDARLLSQAAPDADLISRPTAGHRFSDPAELDWLVRQIAAFFSLLTAGKR